MILHRALAEHLTDYSHVVVSYADRDGYPVNVPTGFSIEHHDGTVLLDPFDAPDLPGDGTGVELTFSHVRPRPGVGYDERRYVNVWGTVRATHGRIAVVPERVAGWDEEHVPFVEYCERNVPRAHRYMADLSAERGEPVRPYLPLRWRFFMATRIPFLTATIVPVALGAIVARAHGHSAWWLAALALVGASCIHLGLNTLNDVFDTASGADPANVTPTQFSGGSRMILYGLVSERGMSLLAAALFAAGIGIGLFLAFTRTIEILWLGAAGVFLSVFYTAPPIRLVHRGLGDVAVAAGFGPIMTLGSYAVVARALSFEALYASLPVAMLVMLILYVNQVPDRHGDAKAGKRTVAVRFGRQTIIAGYVVSVATTFALIAAGALAGVIPTWTLLALAPAPLALRVYRGLVAHYDDPYGLTPAMGTNIGLHLLTGVGLISGYVLHIAA